MRWPKRWPWQEDVPEVPTEEEGRQARADAEQSLRETRDRWPTVHEISTKLERARRESGPDPFVDGLERAMRPRHHREDPR